MSEISKQERRLRFPRQLKQAVPAQKIFMGKLFKRLARWLGLSVAQDAADEIQKRLDEEKKKSKKDP